MPPGSAPSADSGDLNPSQLGRSRRLPPFKRTSIRVRSTRRKCHRSGHRRRRFLRRAGSESGPGIYAGWVVQSQRGSDQLVTTTGPAGAGVRVLIPLERSSRESWRTSPFHWARQPSPRQPQNCGTRRELSRRMVTSRPGIHHYQPGYSATRGRRGSWNHRSHRYDAAHRSRLHGQRQSEFHRRADVDIQRPAGIERCPDADIHCDSGQHRQRPGNFLQQCPGDRYEPRPAPARV